MNVAFRPPPAWPMTREEFFLWAERQDGRHEFDGTRPVPMTGGTNNHGRIARNLLLCLEPLLADEPCEAFGSDAGGVATTGNRVRYPEATVTCSAVPGGARLIPNPVVVFKVVSPSSVRLDQVLKLDEYHAVPSIRRYVVIEQEKIAVTAYSRRGDGPWAVTPFVQGDVLPLPEIGVEVPVAALYRRVVFPNATAD